MSTPNGNVAGARSVILAGIDFSDMTNEIVRTAVRACAAQASELHLVHVLPVPPSEGMGASRADRELEYVKKLERTRAGLDRVAAEASPNVERIAGHIRAGKPDVEIAQLASDLGADLIVVGTHGYRGIDRLLLGSVAESLVRHAPCAVLTYRPKVAPIWEKIVPPCPDCAETQRKTARSELWCARHAQHHPRAHTYSEVPPSFGIGAQTFR